MLDNFSWSPLLPVGLNYYQLVSFPFIMKLPIAVLIVQVYWYEFSPSSSIWMSLFCFPFWRIILFDKVLWVNGSFFFQHHKDVTPFSYGPHCFQWKVSCHSYDYLSVCSIFFFFDSFQDFMVTFQNMIVIYLCSFHCIYRTWGIMKFLYLYVSVFQQIWDVWGIFLQDFFSYP